MANLDQQTGTVETLDLNMMQRDKEKEDGHQCSEVLRARCVDVGQCAPCSQERTLLKMKVGGSANPRGYHASPRFPAAHIGQTSAWRRACAGAELPAPDYHFLRSRDEHQLPTETSCERKFYSHIFEHAAVIILIAARISESAF